VRGRRATPRCKQYEKLGAKLVTIALPRTELSIPVYYIIAPAEASSNLSRFDGVKFGHRAKRSTPTWLDMYKKTRAEGFGAEVKRRIMIGTYVLSATATTTPTTCRRRRCAA
jgi:aspartyl-tRNA(Asn)/glutamyl-tRNA(Gln) amidotransferase subunit A